MNRQPYPSTLNFKRRNLIKDRSTINNSHQLSLAPMAAARISSDAPSSLFSCCCQCYCWYCDRGVIFPDGEYQEGVRLRMGVPNRSLPLPCDINDGVPGSRRIDRTGRVEVLRVAALERLSMPEVMVGPFSTARFDGSTDWFRRIA